MGHGDGHQTSDVVGQPRPCIWGADRKCRLPWFETRVRIVESVPHLRNPAATWQLGCVLVMWCVQRDYCVLHKTVVNIFLSWKGH